MLTLFDLNQLRAQHAHTCFTVLELVALRLAGDNNAGRLVDETHGGTGLVDVLSACTGGAVDLHFDILGPDIDLGLLHLRKHRDRCGRCVDSSAGLRLRDTLHAVDAGLEFQAGIRALAINHKGNFFESSDTVLIHINELCFPTFRFGIVFVHTINLSSK